MLRETIAEQTKLAMKAREAARLSTLRLIASSIKDRDIAARGEGNPDGITDADILSLMGKMIKQRQDSAAAYVAGNRPELAAAELAEVGVIEEFLPRQLNDAETSAAIAAVVARTGATSVRDMGRVMAELKAGYAGQLDFGKVGPMVKAALGGS